jgi:hypothetical protein
MGGWGVEEKKREAASSNEDARDRKGSTIHKFESKILLFAESFPSV